MKANAIKEILERVEGWPESARASLLEAVRDIERDSQGGTYTASPEEVSAIEEGLREADEGLFATDRDVEAVLVKSLP